MFLSRFPQYRTVACLALSLLLFRYSFFLLPFFTDMTNASYSAIEVEMDEMGNAQYQILTLEVDDPTKSSESLVFPAQPTPIVSFTHAMSNSLHHVPNPSLVGPSQIETKPPTVQPASSPTPVTLSVNNQKTPANSRTVSPLVSSPIEAVERTTLQKSSIIHKSFEDMDASVPLSDTVCIHHTRPLKWRIDASNIPEIQADIFQVTPSEGTLANGQEDEFIVSFFPKEEAEYKLSIPLFLNGEKSEYCDITVTALGIKQQLVFEPKELLLLRFLNTSFLASRISVWPESIIEQFGQPLWEVLEAILGEKIPVRPLAEIMQTMTMTGNTTHAAPPVSSVIRTPMSPSTQPVTPTARNRDPQHYSLPQTMSSTPNACRRSSRSCSRNVYVSSRFHYPVPDVNDILFAVHKSQETKETLAVVQHRVDDASSSDHQALRSEQSDSQNPSQRTLQFAVTVSPCFSNPIKATLLYIPKNEGGGQVHPIAMQMVTKVPNPTPSATYSVTTPLYGCAYCEVKNRNPFPNGCALTKQQVQHDTIKLAEKADFCPCRLNTQQLTLINGATGTIQVQFQPISVGVHRCRVMFRDEDQGEFTVEIEEISTIPTPSEPFIIIGQADTASQQEIIFPAKNRRLEAVKAEDSQLEKALFPLLPTPGNSLTYQVESTSPFFSIPKKLQIVLKQPQGLKKALSTADSQKTDTSGGRVRLPFSFRPKQAGEYMCRVVLKSALDIRIFDIKGNSQSPGMEETIDLQTIARKPVSQEIPIANPTLTE
ncbi:hypothetical protein BLNAU_8213 [Blattamonas nauphoetae]|uniref:Uncharacterized protein n=1 Tax=Blattamonas nauphoetae TaxID=2049346 RepID=A0ABQ9XZ51_9EUKA|nr:hypothetical protein BLNAU_8213 [Blattamonas nauphoetae]